MRTLKLLAMAGLAMSTAACVDSVDGNYGYGDGYYAPNQAYYGQPSYYAPTYYAPTQVVTQTRYVPVPAAVPQHSFTPQPSRPNDHPQANNDQHRGNNGNGGNTDRDHDGRPDRRS